MCVSNPVRDALGKATTGQIESALNTAQTLCRDADDPHIADLYQQIVDGMSDELKARYLTVMTRDVLRASQEATREAKALLTQMTS